MTHRSAFICSLGLALAASVLLAQPSLAQSLSASLAGADADGTGTAKVTIDAGKGEVCYELSVANIASASAAHIHKAPAGANGPPVVPLVKPGADGKSSGCATVAADVAREIAHHPADYYVNVHNAEFPGGAVRGQLGN
jgi:CHRD domain